ncbi:iron uptake porin [Spirulina subsalsa FACHB-351]|uniref:Iron uptake porin n=1 Tax=Spirulina subsalsa FACHB-351 TaxID=234711 RepID=A0ABT3L620_9CYAN|nr:iron uptake porin [Spirulina subsalsa]MCW6036961.1 iron uptake porin [Spirulina subsalsa FACHB-351]
MSKNIRKALLAGPATFGALLAVAGNAVASPISTNDTDFVSASDLLQQIDSYSSEGSATLGQAGFTGASQFSDVSPGDWAFQALDDLVRRYGCLAGYPDGTFRGNRALSRYEFAAGLNACLQQIERIIAETTADFVTREDLEVLRRLLQEFEAELVTLGTRVDNLESRTAFLEDNQFSTTTKLVGEAIFNLDIPFGKRANPTFLTNDLGPFGTAIGNNNVAIDGDTVFTDAAGNIVGTAIGFREPPAQRGIDSNLAFSYRARLNFDTSFFGTDRLRTRLQARNNLNLSSVENLGTDMLSPNNYGNSNNQVQLSKLWYYFPLGRNIRFHVGAQGMDIDDIIDSASTNPYAIDGLPLGLAYNTAFYDTQGAGRAAVGANIKFSDRIGLDIGYFAGNANEPTRGIFGGSYALPVQLNFDWDRFRLALGYSRTYAPSGDVFLSGVGDRSAAPFGQNATSGNHYHLAASFDISRRVNLSGWFGYTSATGEATRAALVKGRNADIWNWGVNLAFPDLGKDGAVLVAGFSQLPYASHIQNRPNVRNASYLGNLEYRFPVNDNIEIAPGLFTVLNPQGDARNGAVWGALLRTTFRF